MEVYLYYVDIYGSLFYYGLSVTRPGFLIRGSARDRDKKNKHRFFNLALISWPLSGIRAHGLSVQAIKAYASDRSATGTGPIFVSIEISEQSFVRV
jgi:hypothetical protein